MGALGEKIRTTRISHGFSVLGFAEVANLSLGYVELVEAGIMLPADDDLPRIADALRVTVEDLVEA